jgi:chromosome partitioning protein
MNTVNLVKNNLNPNLTVEGIVLTMADFRTNLSREVILEVKNNFKEKVYETVIPRSIRLSEAPSYGKPIVLYDRNNLGATKYEELTREILGLANIPKTEGIDLDNRIKTVSSNQDHPI